MPNEHDMLTGSMPDGRAYTDGMDHTCNNWTSDGMGTAQLGHADRNGGGNVPGTRRIRAAAAARPIWSRRAARVTTTASPSTEKDLKVGRGA